MKFEVMHEAQTFISLTKDANELNSSKIFSDPKSYLKRNKVQWYVLVPYHVRLEQ